MTTRHTPEPWAVGPWITSEGKGVYANIGSGPDRIASVTVYGRQRDSNDDAGRAYTDRHGTARHTRSVPESAATANAQRIVACVNACTGMDDPAVEISGLRAERDELRAALEDITSAYERALNRFGAHEWGMLTVETARAALAKVRP